MDLIDIGANLCHESFASDLDEVLDRAAGSGVSRVIVTGTSGPDSEAAVALARRHPGRLRSTAGVHPHAAESFDGAAAAAIEALAVRAEVVAVGETGLDFYRDFSPRPDQERAFEAQLDIAARLGLPVFMHERDARRRFVEILKPARDRLGPAVIHCFTGDRDDLHAYLDLDLHVGITGWICDERRGLHLRELVGRIPVDRLMLETDSPYLLPRDLRPRPRSRRNEPAHLAHIAGAVAGATGETVEGLAARTSATARAFFGLPSAPSGNPDSDVESDIGSGDGSRVTSGSTARSGSDIGPRAGAGLGSGTGLRGAR